MKKITKVLGLSIGVALAGGLALSGCASVGGIKNADKDILFNGGSLASVGGYLYFGNSFSDPSAFSGDGDYKSAAAISYLSRLNTNVELSAEGKDFAPKGVQKVVGGPVEHSKAFTFVLGNYVYYVAPKREESVNQESGKSEHNYSYSTLYRVKLNGDGATKIYTTTAEISEIQALKYENKYYIVLLAGTKLVKISLSGDTKATTISDNATSVALPKTYQKNNLSTSLEWNGDIIFTTAREGNENITGSAIKKAKINGETSTLTSTTKAVSFVGRQKDKAFYTYDGETFMYNVNDTLTIGASRLISAAASEIYTIATENGDKGFVYKANDRLYLCDLNGTQVGESFSLKDENGSDTTSYKILNVSGRTIFYLTENGVFRANIENFVNTLSNPTISYMTIVEMSGIKNEKAFGFDGDYIYFYANLQNIENDDEKEAEKLNSDTTNFYMYRANVNRKNDYQLLSKTKVAARNSK